MKVVTREKLVPKQVTEYIASDGRVFNSALECSSYEIASRIEKLGGIETNIPAEGYPPCNGAENMESHSYAWYHPKNAEELSMLLSAYEITDAPLDCIGDWVCIETSEYDDSAWICSLHDCIEYVGRLLDHLGYDMTVIKRGTANE